MVTADVHRPSRPFLGVLARRRKRWRWCGAAMHPLLLPCPPSVPFPVSTYNSAKTAAGNCHRPQQQSKSAASRSRKLRSAASTITLLQKHTHQQHLRTPQPGCRSATGATSTGPRTPLVAAAASSASVDERTKEEKVFNSNMERYKETISHHSQFVYSVNNTEECFQALNATKKRNKRNLLPKKASVKRNENSHSQNVLPPEGCNILKKEGGKPITPGNNYRSLKIQKVGLRSITTLQGDQNYAGPKFSEPPSPSVLPKPPSHWVGVHTDYSEDGNKEIMTVHLKTLLKVNA
ncbi:proline-rich nuclear receptor coactivator 1 [Hypanus sabinus]|uniref:proline-rich nuclear receptor coactivator 1 n=1 Tax=Hypanus sabinus TaxID=79690 RepID=UPI0028C3DBFD|nr:proline-rich nuclear receptor coactivator 1 [Hypanus sabinus]